MSTYEVTCWFDGGACTPDGDDAEPVVAAVASLREAGVDIEHLRSTVDDGADPADPVVRVRLRAPSEGIVGWCVWLTGQPVGGIREVEPSA